MTPSDFAHHADKWDAPLTSVRAFQFEEEIVRLRRELERANAINDAMWGTMVQKAVAQGEESEDWGEACVWKRQTML
jgi:hypothetical protein